VEGWGDLQPGQALPKGLERYIAMIEHHVGAPVTLVSLGPDRAQTVLRQAAMAS
jgi:adenylosuccinate synthase